MNFPRMHVSLYVKNIEATTGFYTRFFGQQPSKAKPGYAKYELEKPSLIISFVENAERVQPHFGHLGLQVDTLKELQQKQEAAKAAGLNIDLEELGTQCCYARQDKFWISDPDGTRWEVYYFHEDVEWNDPEYATEAEACCSPQHATKKTVALSDLSAQPKEEEASCEPGSGCC